MKKDILIKALLADGCIRLIAISGREMAAQARDIHGLSRVCTAALGRQMMATAMMASQLKQEGDSLTTLIQANGPAGNIVCAGRYGAHVKGYVANPHVELPPTADGKLDVSGAVGREGRLTVVRDLPTGGPYTGTCELVSGEIAEDFAQYFTISEQQPSLVYLGTRVRTQTGEVLSSGGLIAQTLPGFPQHVLDEAILALESRAKDIATLAERLELAPLQDVLYAMFHDMQLDILEEITPQFRCDCSQARTERALLALGKQELADMIEQDHGAELACQFCNAVYRFNEEALCALLREAETGATNSSQTNGRSHATANEQ